MIFFQLRIDLQLSLRLIMAFAISVNMKDNMHIFTYKAAYNFMQVVFAHKKMFLQNLQPGLCTFFDVPHSFRDLTILYSMISYITLSTDFTFLR